MNIVSFPGLNLTFNISKIAMSIGNIDIYYYAVFIVLGIGISLILASKTKENFQICFDDFLEIIIFCLIFGIFGARLYYVLFRLDYYLTNPSKIFNIRDGGLAIYGGIIFGAITAYIMCNKKKINVTDFFDYISPYLILSQAIGRIGNFFNIEAYGKETTNIFRMGIYIENVYKEVHPCFLYEFVCCILIFICLRFIQKKRKFKGQVVSLYFILYGMIRFLVEGIRSDSLMFFGFKISQIFSVVFIVLSVVVCLKNRKYVIEE